MNHFIYLISTEENFKIGYSSNPFKRHKQYKTHNINANMQGIFKVESKDVEKSVHLELLKRGYIKCGQLEWFKGNLTIYELQEILNCLRRKKVLCNLDIIGAINELHSN